jgi:hypothetical protein
MEERRRYTHSTQSIKQGDSMRTMHVGAVAFAMIWLLAGVKSIAQSVAVETMRDAYALLSPDEKQSFDAAGKAFGAGKHAEALPTRRCLRLMWAMSFCRRWRPSRRSRPAT